MNRESEDDAVLKILHTADWHLGLRFGRFDREVQPKLTRARLEVIDRILLTAERHGVNAVLCAGDLFDEPCPAQDWWENLAKCFQKRRWGPERPVFLLPGNHDPLRADSVWCREQFRSMLPSFVHIVDRDDFQAPLANGAVLFAVPCTSTSGQDDPTHKIPMREPDDLRIRIGMVHGSTFDVEGCQTNFPIDADAALNRGLDYLAIGDTHGFRFVPEHRRQPPTIYSGTPEPTKFDEKDPGNVAVVFFDKQRRATVRKERVASWTWEEATVESMEALRDLARRPDLDKRVLRLRVAMRVSAPDYAEVERLLDELKGGEAVRGRVGVLEVDRDELALDTSTFETFCVDLPEVLSATVATLTEKLNDPVVRPAAERALYHLYRMSRRAS